MKRRSGVVAVVLVLVAIAFWLRPHASDPTRREGGSSDDGSVRSRLPKNAPSASMPGIDRPDADSILAQGVVLDAARDRAIKNAGVAALRDGVAVLATAAGEDGAFQFVCRRGDLLETRPPGFFRATAPCAATVELRAIPALGLEGRVVLDGKGVPGARVSCVHPRIDFSWKDYGADSGVNGLFSIGCGPDETRLSAQSPSGATGFLDVEPQVGGTVVRDLVIELGDGRRIHGRVTDPRGNPVAADGLVLENGNKKRPLFFKADAAGVFELGASFGPQSVTVVASDGRCARAEVAAGKGDSILELVLPDGSVLHGRLHGASDGVSVTAHRREQGPDEAANIRDAANLHAYRKAVVEGDRFSLAGLEPGKYSLSAKTKSASGSMDVEVPSEAVVLVLEPREYLALTIRRDGVPQTGSAEVDRGERGTSYVSVREGRTELESLSPGEHAISFTPLIGPVPAPTNISVGRGITEVTWDLPPSVSRIEGRVVDAETMLPIPNVSVTPASVRRTSSVWGAHPLALTDESGRFTFAVENGAAPLFFLRDGYVSQVHPADQTSTIRLAPGTSSRSVKREP